MSAPPPGVQAADRAAWAAQMQRRRRPRGPGVLLRVTWPEIARALGISVSTAKKYGTGARRRFDPHDLADLIRFGREYRKRSSKRGMNGVEGAR